MSNSSQKPPFFAALMYFLYGHPRYFNFKRKKMLIRPVFPDYLFVCYNYALTNTSKLVLLNNSQEIKQLPKGPSKCLRQLYKRNSKKDLKLHLSHYQQKQFESWKASLNVLISTQTNFASIEMIMTTITVWKASENWNNC